MAKAGDPRPTEFSSEGGSGRRLSVWKKGKGKREKRLGVDHQHVDAPL